MALLIRVRSYYHNRKIKHCPIYYVSSYKLFLSMIWIDNHNGTWDLIPTLLNFTLET